MEFKRDDCTFTIPDRPTVKQQLAYFSAGAGGDMLLRYWRGAVALIESWECAELPDYKVNLDTITNPSQTNIIIWAGLEVSKHMSALDDIPKN